jgi:hypothetical protein
MQREEATLGGLLGAGRRGAACFDRGRAEHRQVAARRGIPRPARRNAPYLNRTEQHAPLHLIAEWGRQRVGGADAPAGKLFAELEFALRQFDTDETAPLLRAPRLALGRCR